MLNRKALQFGRGVQEIAPLFALVLPAIAGLVGSAMSANKPQPAQISGGGGISMSPVQDDEVQGSKMQAATEEADSFISPGSSGDYKALPGSGQYAKTGENMKEAGQSMNDMLQMAAMASQLGGILGPGKAPPPPGAPSGGGIGMQPVFQSARDLYGG